MLTQSIRDRVNLTIAAARYPWQVSWDTDAARDWLDWWQEWASRAAEAGEPKEHALIVKEAIEKVRAFEPDLPDDEPEPEREHEPGERAFGQGESSPTQSRDMSDTEPQPGEPSGASQDDAEGPGEPEGSNDPTDPEGGPEGGPDEPPGDDSDPKGEDADPDGWAVEDDSDPEPEPEPEPGQGGEGGEDDSQASATGSHGDSNPSQPEPWEEGRLSQEDYDSACVKDASRDFDDAVLQSKAEKVTRGTREGMRKRHYRHPSSVYGQSNYGGRNVVSIPRKGKRWVYDI
jgi:hypothetical protein